MNPSRRHLKMLKRILIFLTLYVATAYLFVGVSPWNALLHPGASLAQYRTFVVYLILILSIAVGQFAAIFWFMARGNDYVIYPGEYDKTFDDVRGQPAAVTSTQEVLRLFEGFKDFKQMGGYPPHGILFEGPPGTGKTLLAKAVAGATGVPFLYTSGSGFASMFFGVGNLKVRRLFKRARNMSDKYGGAVIFIDEIDAIAGSRGAVSERSTPISRALGTNGVVMAPGMMGGGGMMGMNELLVQMDGLVVPRGLWRHIRRILGLGKPQVPFYNILIIGATNRASTLDAALLRPGRFDRKIHVGLPTAEGREDIARYYLAKVRHEPIDVPKLSRMTSGYSPAQIQNLVNEALIFALQDGRDALRWDDLWQAKLSEEIGLKQVVTYTPEEKQMVAVHEAAHAVAAYNLEKGRSQIQVMTIQKREDALGLVSRQYLQEFYLRTQKQVLANIQISLAGMVAEEIWYAETTSGPASDLQAATVQAALYVGVYGMGRSLISAPMDVEYGETVISAVLADPERRREVDAILADCRTQVRGLLVSKRRVVEGVRDALLEREELIGDEIEALMAELGEREPLEVPVGALTGDGPAQRAALAPGDRVAGGNGSGNGSGPGAPDAAPPRPDLP
ncbi:MAG TPA: AAA family ATPase [Actinomycetota bacterium]